MEPEALALRTALFTLLGIVLTIMCWLLLGERQGDVRHYLVTTGESVSGLAEQSRVYYKGVEAGSVQDIFFAADDYDNVQILIQVSDSIPIAENTFGQLSLRGITGEYDLRLDNEGSLGKPLSTSVENPAVIPMKTEYITQLGSLMETVLRDVSDAWGGISKLLNNDNQADFRRLLNSVANAADDIARIDDLLAPTLAAIPALLDKLTNAISAYEQMAITLSARTVGSAEAITNIANAGDSIEQLSTQLRSRTVPRMGKSLEGIDRATEELAGLAEQLRENPQQLIVGAKNSTLGPGETPSVGSQ